MNQPKNHPNSAPMTSPGSAPRAKPASAISTTMAHRSGRSISRPSRPRPRKPSTAITAAPPITPASPEPCAVPTKSPAKAPAAASTGSAKPSGFFSTWVSVYVVMSLPQLHVVDAHDLVIGPVKDQHRRQQDRPERRRQPPVERGRDVIGDPVGNERAGGAAH